MRIIVTGGAGFIASHVVDAYLAEGHDVAVIDDLTSGSHDNVNARARWYQVDIRSPEVDEIIESERPDVLSHARAKSVLGWSAEVKLGDGLRATWDWFASRGLGRSEAE
jgi:UDP-glucose 4-epimerase